MTILTSHKAESIDRTMIDCLMQASTGCFIKSDGTATPHRQIANRAISLASALMSRGIAKGDRVAISGSNTVEFVVAEYAVLMCGGVVVPINTRLAPAEIHGILEHSCARMAIYEPDVRHARLTEAFQTDRPESLEQVLTFDALPVSKPRALPVISPDDLAMLMYTSGTTGAPKGCLHAHRSLVDSAAITSKMKNIGPSDRVLASVPFFNAFGSINCILEALIGGASVILQHSFDAKESLELIDRHQATCFLGTPTMWHRLLKHENRPNTNLSSLRTGIITGAPFEDALVAQWKELGCEAVASYGLTEELSILVNGRPSPGSEVRLDGLKLHARGISQMKGYFNNPELTQTKRDKDGWWDTGDLAELLPDGRLRVIGRHDDMMICGGFNVYPSEIEEVLRKMEGIVDAAVVGVPDADMGESIVAWIIVQPEITLETDTILNFCRERLAHYKVPKRIKVVSDLPLTANGKVQKFMIIRAETS